MTVTARAKELSKILTNEYLPDYLSFSHVPNIGSHIKLKFQNAYQEERYVVKKRIFLNITRTYNGNPPTFDFILLLDEYFSSYEYRRIVLYCKTHFNPEQLLIILQSDDIKVKPLNENISLATLPVSHDFICINDKYFEVEKSVFNGMVTEIEINDLPHSLETILQ